VLSPAQLDALFLEVHRGIEDSARHVTNSLAPAGRLPQLAYPPNPGLSAEEQAALAGLASTPEAASGLRKVIADAIASSFFTFLNLLDGTADPMHLKDDHWPGFELVESEASEQMLHDHFFESYWLWRARRPDPGWTLDTYDG
jgi:hypothetical protein